MNADERERIVHEVAAKHLVPGDYEHALRELTAENERLDTGGKRRRRGRREKKGEE
jgi:hypothetical protein